MFDERRHNYPDDYEKGPYCPHTKLIQICASLTGVELTPENFCTEKMSNTRYSDGFIHYLESADFHPAASCAQLNHKLDQQIELAEKKISLTPDNIIKSKLDKINDISSIKKTADKYATEKELYLKKQEILTRWKTVIFKTSVSTTQDEKNVHFRQFKSEEELPDEEVLNKVKKFKAALEKITGFDKEQFGWYWGEVKNCPQAPTHHHYGPIY
ncbi:MAG: hypothetical protein ABSC49_01375 [Candidatus Microgenomates bacterium]|jgi:hypothetical protein